MTQNYLSWEAIKWKFSSQRNYDKKKLKEKKNHHMMKWYFSVVLCWCLCMKNVTFARVHMCETTLQTGQISFFGISVC